MVANILAGPLKRLCPTISQLVNPQGDLGLSGILETQSASVCQAYAEHFALDPVTVGKNGVELRDANRLPIKMIAMSR